MKKKGFLRSLFYFIGIISSVPALAYDQPQVNLGYTSFLDGGPPAGPGLYYQNYFQYYHSNLFTNDKGKRLPFPLTKLDVTANIFQLIYLSSTQLFGGNVGVSAVLPYVVSASVNEGLNNTVFKAQNGPSNLFIGPALQFDPILRNGKPFFVQRFELDTVVPLGRYHRDYTITPATPFWSINPYWAATLWLTEKWTAAWRLHYLWNEKTNRPTTSFGPDVYSTQAGEAIFGDIATSYGITDVFHVGINSYFFYQITDTKVNGEGKPGRREKVWAIGPGMLYGLTKNQFLFFNLYFEQGARNRTQGTNALARYVVHF